MRRDHVVYGVREKRHHLMNTEGNAVHYGFIDQFIAKPGERHAEGAEPSGHTRGLVII